jgi:hypothetical protein
MSTNADNLLIRAARILATPSSPAMLYGWALGVAERSQDEISTHDGKTGEGYERGWDEMDRAISEVAVISS